MHSKMIRMPIMKNKIKIRNQVRNKHIKEELYNKEGEQRAQKKSCEKDIKVKQHFESKEQLVCIMHWAAI